MMGMPAPNQFDVKFTLLGVPVRINPFFWVLAAAIGWQDRDGIEILIWIGCVFVSILVHEFGHALTGRALAGLRPTVVLYMAGRALRIRPGKSDARGRRILTLLMGPGSGVLACWRSVAGPRDTRCSASSTGRADPVRGLARRPRGGATSLLTPVRITNWLWINLVWGLFNLLPIFPLDGGPDRRGPALDPEQDTKGRSGPTSCRW